MNARYRTQRWVATEGHNVRSLEPDGSTRAIADVIFGDDAVRAAHACMIAATPELLEISTDALDILEVLIEDQANWHRANGMTPDPDSPAIDLLARFRSAIAKAEGQP